MSEQKSGMPEYPAVTLEGPIHRGGTVHRDDYDRLEQRLSESLHNWQVLNLQILAELRPPTVTEQSIPERVKAMREQLERAETRRRT